MEIKNIDSEIFEQEIIGKSREEIENLLDLPLESKSNEQYVFILKKIFFGLFKKKLYLYFHKEIVRDYYIGIE